MKVRIAILIGSNGRYAAMNADGGDWGCLADSIMDQDGGKWKDPELSVRYIIEADVPLPQSTNVIQAESLAQQVASP